MYGSSIWTTSAPAAEKIVDLFVDGGGVVKCQLFLCLVGVVLRLLGHREGAGHGHLDRAVGVGQQEGKIPQLHRVLAPDLSHDAGHRVRMATAVERGARVLDVDALERGREAVGVALAAGLAIRDDVEPGPLLVTDGQDGGIVLGLLKPFRRHSPQLQGPDAGRETPASLARSMSQSGWA